MMIRLWSAKTWLLVWAAALLIAGTSRAEERPSDSARASVQPSSDSLSYVPPAWPDAPDTAAMLRRLVLGTATVLGLCVCTLWVGRRWLRGAPIGATTGKKLRLVETVTLSNRCSVHLLQTGDHQVLVGTDSSGLKSLVPLPASFENVLAEVKPGTVDDEPPIAGRAAANFAMQTAI